MFQSTHPHGVRPSGDGARIDSTGVSIHAPTRGATISLSRYLDIAGFQSTHPHGVRLTDALCVAAMILFQSTHPHGVRHCIMPTEIDVYIVSIHAPTRGATMSKTICDLKIDVSIHAPTRGATFGKNTTYCPTIWFQSTHPHGVRLYTNTLNYGLNCVSIHAPTRGATMKSC